MQKTFLTISTLNSCMFKKQMFQSKSELLKSQQWLNNHSKVLGGNIHMASSELSMVGTSTQF